MQKRAGRGGGFRSCRRDALGVGWPGFSPITRRRRRGSRCPGFVRGIPIRRGCLGRGTPGAESARPSGRCAWLESATPSLVQRRDPETPPVGSGPLERLGSSGPGPLVETSPLRSRSWLPHDEQPGRYGRHQFGHPGAFPGVKSSATDKIVPVTHFTSTESSGTPPRFWEPGCATRLRFPKSGSRIRP